MTTMCAAINIRCYQEIHMLLVHAGYCEPELGANHNIPKERLKFPVQGHTHDYHMSYTSNECKSLTTTCLIPALNARP